MADAGETSFYSNAVDYWRDVPPTVDGMLGGYGSISSIDINGSKGFLRKFLGVRTSRCSPDALQHGAASTFRMCLWSGPN